MRHFKKSVALFICVLSIYACSSDDSVLGVDIHDGDVVIHNLEELESFGQLGIKTINGDLTISPEDEDWDDSERLHLANLFLLRSIETVKGNLSIRFTAGLESLDGLDNLKDLSGSIFIQNNEDLISLRGLEKITEIISLQVFENHSLESLDGIQNLNKVNSIHLSRNRSLIRLTQLTSLTQLSFLVIAGNTQLTSLEGLNRLEGCSEILSILRNNSLKELDGLNSLTQVGLLDLGENIILKNLTALSSLTSAKAISITRNNALERLDGLQNIVTILEGSLDIWDNPSLTSLNGLNNQIEFLGQPGWTTRQSSNIRIGGNPRLEDLGALRFQGSLFNQLSFWNMPLVTELPRFGPDVAIGDLRIEGLDQLTDLDPLSGINGFIFNLMIKDNPQISNLNALAKVTSINQNIEVLNNTSLSDFCGISRGVNVGVFEKFDIQLNRFNPSLDDFDQGNCSN